MAFLSELPERATLLDVFGAFPHAATNYLLVFHSLKSGGPKSENLFTGSALLAGTADIGVLRTP